MTANLGKIVESVNITHRQLEILLREYESMSRFVSTFFVARATLLGIGTALLGTILKFSMEATPPFSYFYDLCAVLFVYILGLMIGATIRASYVFANRMSQISEELGVLDYWTIWSIHSRYRPQDSGTRPFTVALIFLYGVVFIFIALNHFAEIARVFDTSVNQEYIILRLSILLLSFILLITATVQTYLGTEPKNFAVNLNKVWQDSVDIAKQDKLDQHVLKGSSETAID